MTTGTQGVGTAKTHLVAETGTLQKILHVCDYNLSFNEKKNVFLKRSQNMFSCLFLTVSEPWLCTLFAFPCFKRKLASQQKPKSDDPLWCSQLFLVDK